MNFLAHLVLSDDSPTARIGNLLGDFTRGPIDKIPLPPAIIHGIRLHRSIDAFTDSHPSFSATRKLIAPERRRFAPITIDLFWDHFISTHWHLFSEQQLPQFIQQVYSELETHPQWLPDRLQLILPVMKRQNWLLRYRTLEGMDLSFQDVSQRSPRISPLAESIQDLTKNYQAIEQQFHSFHPDLTNHISQWKKQNPMPAI